MKCSRFSTLDSPPLHPPLLPSSPSVRFCSALFYPYAFHPRTNCTSEVVDLSRTSVAGNLPDCEETSSYVGIYRAFIFQRILIRKCTSFVFRERYEYSPLSPHDLSFEVSNRSNCLNTCSSPPPLVRVMYIFPSRENVPRSGNISFSNRNKPPSTPIYIYI